MGLCLEFLDHAETYSCPSRPETMEPHGSVQRRCSSRQVQQGVNSHMHPTAPRLRSSEVLVVRRGFLRSPLAEAALTAKKGELA